MIRPLFALFLALTLAGCASGRASLAPGGWSDAVDSFGTDHSFSFSCSRYDRITGLLTDQVIVNRNLAPNAAVVAQAGAAIQGVIGLVGAAKTASAAAADTANGGGRPLDVRACLGEHDIGTPPLADTG